MSTSEKMSMGRNRTGTGVGSSVLHEDRQLLLVSSGSWGQVVMEGELERSEG